jgi:hypothetical protein
MLSLWVSFKLTFLFYFCNNLPLLISPEKMTQTSYVKNKQFFHHDKGAMNFNTIKLQFTAKTNFLARNLNQVLLTMYLFFNER